LLKGILKAYKASFVGCSEFKFALNDQIPIIVEAKCSTQIQAVSVLATSSFQARPGAQAGEQVTHV
jgi:hypothetical protein